MTSRSRLSCIFVAAFAAYLGSSAQGAAKFEEQVLVSDVTSATVIVSPTGVNVAAVLPKGSRQVVAYNGVEGPKFEGIATPGFFTFDGDGGKSKQLHNGTGTTHVRMLSAGLSGPTPVSQILFNAQGTHFAYVGRNGAEHAIMLDNKELHRGEHNGVSFMAFSPDGEHLVVVAGDKDGANQQVFIDGQAGPPSSEGFEIFFTPDGKNHAYLGRQASNQARWMVVNGRQVKYLGDIVGFTPSGFLFTRVSANGDTILLGNGKAMTQVNSINHLSIAPKTGKLIMQVTPPLGTPPRKKPSVITVDGQILPGTEDATINATWFSPDGKRYAILCQRYTNGSETFMIVDGKKEPRYANIYTTAPFVPSFSPDSAHFGYVAQAAPGSFIVLDGEESEAFQSIRLPLTWNSTGSHFAYGGMTPAQKRMYYVNNKPIPLPPNMEPSTTFRFTPDGAHTSWHAGGQGDCKLFVDDTPITGVVATGFVGGQAVDGKDLAVKLSPDGKYRVYPGRDPKNPARLGMWVNDKLITTHTLPQVNRVTFTPDGQHVAWAIAGLKDNRGAYRVFVDGREVVSYHSSGADETAGAWEMGADGTLTFLGADGSALKRYRIPPPSDSNITSMLAAAN